MNTLLECPDPFVANKSAVVVVVEVDGAGYLRKFAKCLCVSIDDTDARSVSYGRTRLALAPSVFGNNNGLTRESLANEVDILSDLLDAARSPCAVVLIARDEIEIAGHVRARIGV